MNFHVKNLNEKKYLTFKGIVATEKGKSISKIFSDLLNKTIGSYERGDVAISVCIPNKDYKVLEKVGNLEDFLKEKLIIYAQSLREEK